MVHAHPVLIRVMPDGKIIEPNIAQEGDEAGEYAQQGGLSRTIGALDPVQALLQFQYRDVKNRPAPKFFLYGFQFQHTVQICTIICKWNPKKIVA